MKSTGILLLFLLGTFGSFACLNEFGNTLSGERMEMRYFYLADHHRHFNKQRLNQQLSTLRAKPDAADYRNQSDIAVVLLKLGKTKEASEILEKLIESHPDDYNITANLGTAYELSGDLENALKYIKRGYELNSNSHYGSEWIHIRILQAKIMEKRRPGWMNTHSIVKVEELVEKLGDLRRYRFRPNHLHHQIVTRVPFTPAPNKVIANLLVTLAEFNEKHGTYENALMSYIYSMEFKPDRSHKRKIREKIASLNEQRKAAGIKHLPEEFIRLMEIADLDPRLLIAGLPEFEKTQFEKDSTYHSMKDTISDLRQLLDSLSNTKQNAEGDYVITQSDSKSSSLPWVIAIVAICSSIGLGIVLLRRKKSS